jgi:hypothetical protein
VPRARESGVVIGTGKKKPKDTKRDEREERAERVKREQARRLIEVEERSGESLAALAAAVEALQSRVEQDARSMHAQIERLVTTQERTNRLLELALQAGFEDEEARRST